MKTPLKKLSLQIGVSLLIFSGVGISYAALSTVNSGDSLTHTMWNEVINSINNFEFDSGNVGIGVNTPSNKLEVDGTVSATAFVGDGSALTNLPSSGGSSKFIDGTDANDAVYNTGNVGIGTSAPTEKLDINGAINLADGSGNAIIRGNGRDFAVMGTSGSTYFKSIGGGTAIRLEPNNITAMTLLDGGNVGIGTDSPSAKLDIQGDFNIQLNPTNGYGLTLGRTNANYIKALESGASLYLQTTNEMQFQTGGSGTDLYIATGGNVGIGTTSPGAKLHVEGGAILGAARDTNGNALKICTGETIAGSTNYIDHALYSVYIDLDMSACGFSSTPTVTSSLAGTTSHWRLLGASNPYNITPTTFRIYLSNISTSDSLTPAGVNSIGAYMQWQAMGE